MNSFGCGLKAKSDVMSKIMRSLTGMKMFTGAASKRHRGSSRNWIRRHNKDPYVKKAWAQGSPSRAIYKLEQIDMTAGQLMSKKLKLSNHKGGMLKPGSTVIDLGAAPGGWSKYVAGKIKANGLLISVDLLPLDDGVVNSIDRDSSSPQFFELLGDFTETHMKNSILNLIKEKNSKVGGSSAFGADFIISDMAANFTGDQSTDALRTMNLCEEALMLAAGTSCFDERYIVGSDQDSNGILHRGGSFLCKYFACGKNGELDLMEATKRHFKLTSVIKPKASRKESAELYLFAAGYKGGKVQTS